MNPFPISTPSEFALLSCFKLCFRGSELVPGILDEGKVEFFSGADQSFETILTSSSSFCAHQSLEVVQHPNIDFVGS
jgi:hypothetical protein